MKVAEFNRLTDEEARVLLLNCCGSARWGLGMLAGRPYHDMAAVVARADQVWRETGPPDWEEAFAHHPRIGETGTEAPVGETARQWSAVEQGGMAGADAAARRALVEANREYERRFGRIYIVCASGRGPDELIEDLRARMSHPPGFELMVAKEEQRKITRQRILGLFSEERTAHS